MAGSQLTGFRHRKLGGTSAQRWLRTLVNLKTTGNKRSGDHCQHEVSNVTKWRDPHRVETARRNRITYPSRWSAPGAGAAPARRTSVTCVLCGAACNHWPLERQATRIDAFAMGRTSVAATLPPVEAGRPSSTPRDLRLWAHVREAASAEPPLARGRGITGEYTHEASGAAFDTELAKAERHHDQDPSCSAN